MIKASFNPQQHNDPKHTSKMCQQHLKTKQSDRILNILVWPPQSPDLNPVELEGKFEYIIIKYLIPIGCLIMTTVNVISSAQPV